MAGRPSLLDKPSIIEGLTNRQAIVDALEHGSTLRDAAGRLGIGESTVKAWAARHRDFAAAIEKARCTARANAVASIMRAAEGADYTTTRTKVTVVRDAKGEVVKLADGSPMTVTETVTTAGVKFQWQAAAWLLERTDADNFGRHKVWRDPTKPTEPDDTPAPDRIADAVERFLASREAAPATDNDPTTRKATP